jgi:hypothetical protein
MKFQKNILPPSSGTKSKPRSCEQLEAIKLKKLNSVALVHEQTIPTEQQPLVGEVSTNLFADRGCHVVSGTDPHLGFLGQSHYYF